MGKVSLRSRQPPVTLTWVFRTFKDNCLVNHSSSSAHIPRIVKLRVVSDFFSSEECNKCASGTKYVYFFHFHLFLLLTGGIQCYTHPPIRLHPLTHSYILFLLAAPLIFPISWTAPPEPSHHQHTIKPTIQRPSHTLIRWVAVPVPWPPENYLVEEVGLHEYWPWGLRKAQGGCILVFYY
jgi:hypothetical protein